MTLFTGSDLTCIRGERTVFHALEFVVAEGEALYLKGPNGSGKSTLLRVMAGLLRVISGSLEWSSVSVDDDWDGFRERLHYVGHRDAIKGALTVEENLRFWAAMRDIEAEKQSIGPALETFGISHLASLRARFLSAGQARRLNLARLVATAAPIWLLDEPATSLDAESAVALEKAIESHRQKGGLIVMATHEAVPADAKALDVSVFADDGTGEAI